MTNQVNKINLSPFCEGRYKSSPIETDIYLLACHRYVERNPVKAGVVEHEQDYEWSSYRQHAGIEEDYWIDNDPAYMSIANNKEERMQRYRDYLNQPGSENECQLIHTALQRNQLTGSSRFVDEIEKRLGQRIEQRGPGRPRRKS